MAETLGTLIDKVSIINIKLFMVEDRRREKISKDLKCKLSDMSIQLNSERNDLIKEIDIFLQNAILGKVKIVRGSNLKFYKHKDY